MTVISVSVIISSDEIISGIPRSVSLEVNMPATIFYTLDGSTPTLNSFIYVSPIFLPTDQTSVILQAFASNGTDTSVIISETYETDILNNARLPHSSTNQQPEVNRPINYPFGSGTSQNLSTFSNPANSGVNVYDPSVSTSYSGGFDGDGYQNNFSNQPFTSSNYSIIYATTDNKGQSGRGIGNLPGTITIQEETAIPETTNQFTNMFDPRAFVVYQDLNEQDPSDPPVINSQFIVLEDTNKVRGGGLNYTSGLDAPPANGTFIRNEYNPRKNEMTSYYYDSWANRWLITTAPYTPHGTFDGNLGGIFSGRNNKYVFEWIPFGRRFLF